MPVGEFDTADDRFDYESELKDDEDTIQFGKYKGLTPLDVLRQDPGYIVWANSAYPQGWVGSSKIIEAAKKIVPDQGTHINNKKLQQTGNYKANSGGVSHFNSPEVYAFEEAMLEAFGEFPTPYWKTAGVRYD